MDFACAKGPSIVADGFDMVIIRTSAINGSMSSWGGAETLVSTFGLNPGWLLFWGGSGSLELGIVLFWVMWVVTCLLIHVTPGIHLTAEEIHTASV